MGGCYECSGCEKQLLFLCRGRMYFFASSKRCRQPLAVQHRGLCLPPKKLVLGPVQGVSSYEDLCPARQGPAERGWLIANCQLGASVLLPQAEAGSQPHAAQEGADGCHERCCESLGSSWPLGSCWGHRGQACWVLQGNYSSCLVFQNM